VKYIIYFGVLVVLSGITLGFFNHYRIVGVAPNLLLLFTVFAALEQKNLDFMFIAFIGGLFADSYTGVSMGSFLVGFLTIGFIGHIVHTRVVFLNSLWKYLPIAVVVAVLGVYAWVWVFNNILFYFHVWSVTVSTKAFRHMLPALLVYNIILMYPVYFVYTFVRNTVAKFELKKKGFTSL